MPAVMADAADQNGLTGPDAMRIGKNSEDQRLSGVIHPDPARGEGMRGWERMWQAVRRSAVLPT